MLNRKKTLVHSQSTIIQLLVAIIMKTMEIGVREKEKKQQQKKSFR